MRKGCFSLLVVLPLVFALSGCGLITRTPFFGEDPSQPLPQAPSQPPQPLPAQLILPPKEYVRPGATITGRVLVDPTSQQKLDPQTLAATLQGGVVDDGKQRVPVNGKGLFVLKLAEDAQSVWVRLVTPAMGSKSGMYFLPEVSHEVIVTPSGEIQTVTPGTASGGFRCEAPPTAQAGPPYIVTGNLPGGGNGLATTAQFGRQDAPLLWKTDGAAAFDTSGLQPGPQIFSLRENGQLIAAGAVHGVRLTATTDRSTLKRKEVANFEVKVEGLPGDFLAQKEAEARAAGKSGDASTVAFLDYVNYTPNVGYVEGKPNQFSVPMSQHKMLATSNTASGSDTLSLLRATARTLWPEYSGPSQPSISVLDTEGQMRRVKEQGGKPGAETSEQLPKALTTSYSFTDTQRYRADHPGSFNVRVTLRLPESATQSRALATKEWTPDTPLALTPLSSNEVISEVLLRLTPSPQTQLQNPPAPTVTPSAPGSCAACQTHCDGECAGSTDPGCASRCTSNCSQNCQPSVTIPNPTPTPCVPGPASTCEGACDSACSSACQGTNDPGCVPHCMSRCGSQCPSSCAPGPAPTCEGSCGNACDSACQGSNDPGCRSSCQSHCIGGGCQPTKVPGKFKWVPLELKRGLTSDNAIFRWREGVIQRMIQSQELRGLPDLSTYAELRPHPANVKSLDLERVDITVQAIATRDPQLLQQLRGAQGQTQNCSFQTSHAGPAGSVIDSFDFLHCVITAEEPRGNVADPMKMTIKIDVEPPRHETPSAGPSSGIPPSWAPVNFKLELPGGGTNEFKKVEGLPSVEQLRNTEWASLKLEGPATKTRSQMLAWYQQLLEPPKSKPKATSCSIVVDYSVAGGSASRRYDFTNCLLTGYCLSCLSAESAQECEETVTIHVGTQETYLK